MEGQVRRDERDPSLAQILLLRRDVASRGLRVKLRVPSLVTCDGFLSIEFDLRDPSKQELGTAAWRQRNSRYVYHVTLGRVGDFDRGELEDAWRGIRERLDRREGTLHGYFARGSTCFYLKKTDRG